MSSKDYFNNVATKWDSMRSEYFGKEVRALIINRLNIKEKVIADLGCGTGFITLALAEEGAKLVFSIDQSKNMIRELSKQKETLGYENIYPLISELEELPLFDNSVDGITINMALHHIHNPQKSINEMYRVLKPGGTVIITDVNEHNGQWAREEMHDVWLGFSNSDITNWLENAGFNSVAIENTNLTAKAYSSKGEYTETGIFLAKGIKY